MKKASVIFMIGCLLSSPPVVANDLFTEIYTVLNATDNNSVLESVETIHPGLDIEISGNRAVMILNNDVIANFPAPVGNADYGETTSLFLEKLAEQDVYIPDDAVASALVRGAGVNGRYISNNNQNGDKILTSLGIDGARDERENFRIFGVVGGSSADLSGVKYGDIITKINGEFVANLSDTEISDVMDGANSGTVKMKITTEFGERNIVLRRASVVLADADVIKRQVTSDKRQEILEIIVHKISDNSVQIVTDALDKYSPNGIILDLRAAGGSDEYSVAKLAGLFVGAKPIIRIANFGCETSVVANDYENKTNAPMVVLLSGATNGAAIGLASAIYENARGVLVGTPTSVNAKLPTEIKLKSGGSLELFNRVIKSANSGRDLDGRGMFPIVCLSNIRSAQQQGVFFLNVQNDEFNARDFNADDTVSVASVHRGCPAIVSGADEDNVSVAVAVKILLDKQIYERLRNVFGQKQSD